MSKSPNQRMIGIHILNYLQKNSNESHPVTATNIIDYLATLDITAERKTVYAYIKELNECGYDVFNTKGKNGGYYTTSGVFELPELLIFANAVQAGKFISEKKSKQLIKKLTDFVNKYDAEKFNRKLYIANRAKTENEKIYYAIDEIYSAINANRILNFTYCEWTVDKVLVEKHDGKIYRVTPNALVWDDENYYLIAHDEDDDKIKYFRADKMRKVTATEEKGCPNSVFKDINPAEMSKNTFGMFGGKKKIVTLKCKDWLCGVIFDRFGNDIIVDKNKNGTFCVSVDIAVSGQFFGWVSSFGGDMTIKAPQCVAEEYKEHLKKTCEGIL